MSAKPVAPTLLQAAQRLIKAQRDPRMELGGSKAHDEASFALDDLERAVLAAAPAGLQAGSDAKDAQLAAVVAMVRADIEAFKREWWKVPPFADRVKKATREQISIATSIVVNIPCKLDAIQNTKTGEKAE